MTCLNHNSKSWVQSSHKIRNSKFGFQNKQKKKGKYNIKKKKRKPTWVADYWFWPTIPSLPRSPSPSLPLFFIPGAYKWTRSVSRAARASSLVAGAHMFIPFAASSQQLARPAGSAWVLAWIPWRLQPIQPCAIKLCSLCAPWPIRPWPGAPAASFLPRHREEDLWEYRCSHSPSTLPIQAQDVVAGVRQALGIRSVWLCGLGIARGPSNCLPGFSIRRSPWIALCSP
jgi:hypothetical protein